MDRLPYLLMVEDEHVLRGLVADFLRQVPYHVVEAADGLEGVARFREAGPFDLVLADLNMPRLDGVGVCREIRRVRPEQPILVVSAAVLPDHRRELDDLGVDHYLTKPYHPEKLLRTIEALLGDPTPSAAAFAAGQACGL